MTLTPYQVVVPGICLIAVLYAWNLVVRKKKTALEAIFWTLFWGAIAAAALFPNALSYLSAVTGIANQENAVIITFLGILFFMVFYMVIRLEELEQRHSRLVREIALKDAGLDEGKMAKSEEGKN